MLIKAFLLYHNFQENIIQYFKLMIIALFGNGKGKTTSAVGTMLRSINLGRKVVFIQLHKDIKNFKSNEILFLGGLELSNLTIKQFGKSRGWVNFKNPSKEDLKLTSDAIVYVKNAIEKGRADLVVLDEILLAHYYNLCSDDDLINIIENTQKKELDLILTGGKMKKSLIKYCDLITEFRDIKHPITKGILAKEGIDY